MEARERILKALEDMQDCASFVVAAAEGKDLAYYRRDRLFRQAVERNLEIIGEAIGRISRYDAETASRISEHRRIVAFRNRLIHGYHNTPSHQPRSALSKNAQPIAESDRRERADEVPTRSPCIS